MCGWCRKCSTGRIWPRHLRRPALFSLSIPVDVFNAQAEGYEASFKIISRSANFAAVNSVNFELERARELIAKAKSPVVIVGSGAHWVDNPEEIRGALSELGIPVSLPSLQGVSCLMMESYASVTRTLGSAGHSAMRRTRISSFSLAARLISIRCSESRRSLRLVSRLFRSLTIRKRLAFAVLPI